MFSRLPCKFCLFLLFVIACANVPRALPQQGPVPKPNPSARPLAANVAATEDDAEYHEDFSSISLKGSAFFPLPPALGPTDNNPIMPFVRERWQLMWRPADPIELFVCKPRGSSEYPVILFLYTYPSTADRFKSDDWCGAATSNGFAAVGFLSAYTGDRLDMRPPAATFFTDFQESLGASVHDVQLILDYLATRNDMDMSRVGMFGQGSGGTITILASAADPRIKVLDVLTPWGDWPAFFAQTKYVAADKRARFVSPEFQAKIAGLEPLTWLSKVQARSVRIQDVRASGPMPDASQERLEAVAPQRAIINQYGDSAALVPHASGGALFDWLRTQLQPDAKPQMALDKSERIHFYPPAAVDPLPKIGPTASKKP